MKAKLDDVFLEYKWKDGERWVRSYEVYLLNTDKEIGLFRKRPAEIGDIFWATVCSPQFLVNQNGEFDQKNLQKAFLQNTFNKHSFLSILENRIDSIPQGTSQEVFEQLSSFLIPEDYPPTSVSV